MTLLVFYKKRAVSVSPGPSSSLVRLERTRLKRSYELTPTPQLVRDFTIPWLGEVSETRREKSQRRRSDAHVLNARDIISSRPQVGFTSISASIVSRPRPAALTTSACPSAADFSRHVFSGGDPSYIKTEAPRSCSGSIDFSHFTDEEILFLLAA